MVKLKEVDMHPWAPVKNLPPLEKENFIKGISPLCETLAVDNYVDLHHRGPTPEETRNLKDLYIEESVEFLESKMGRLHHASVLLLEFLPKFFSKEDTEQVVSDFKQGAELFKTLEPPIKPTLQEKLKISADSLSKCFEIGKYLFENQRFGDAGPIFEMLVFLNPYLAPAWLDLGLTYHELGKLNEALQAYAATYLLDPKPLFARAKSIEAYLALNQKADASAEFDELEQLVYINPDDHWKEILQSLAKKIGAAK